MLLGTKVFQQRVHRLASVKGGSLMIAPSLRHQLASVKGAKRRLRMRVQKCIPLMVQSGLETTVRQICCTSDDQESCSRWREITYTDRSKPKDAQHFRMKIKAKDERSDGCQAKE